MQVSDYLSDEAFESLLDQAGMNAANDWEVSFVSDLTEKYEEYGRRMYLSELQRQHLERIAEN